VKKSRLAAGEKKRRHSFHRQGGGGGGLNAHGLGSVSWGVLKLEHGGGWGLERFKQKGILAVERN